MTRTNQVSFTALAAVSLFSATAGYAETPASLGGDATDVSPLVVTATRIPTPVTQVADSISLFTAADIAAKQEQTLPDVLKDSPGLNVVQTGGPGGLTSVFMRGTNSDHVKVLVDGIDVGDPSNSSAFDFGQFLTPDIDRVEVLRGPQSGLYGSDAIGGVINVITKSGEGPTKVDVGLEGGSFDTFNQNASVGGSSGPFHYVANLEHMHVGATPVTPLDLLAPGEQRIDDYYDNITASTKLGYNVTNNFDLGLVGRYTNSHLRFTGENELNFPIDFPDSAQSRTDTLQYYTRGSAHLALFDNRFEQTLGAAYSGISSTEASPDGPTTSYFSGDRIKLDWQGDIKIEPGETLVLGAEHDREELRAPVSAHTTTTSGYVELQSNPFPDFYDTVSGRYDANGRFGNAATYRVAPTYLIAATGTKLEASVGTGFKAPTLSQMFQNFPSFGFFGNPNLRPETSTGYDAGFEQTLLRGGLQFGATYYYIRIRNLIGDNATFTSYANVGRAHTDGVESYVAYKPVDALRLRLDYTYTDAVDDILHEELLRRPRNKWNLDARWQATGKLSLDADLVSIGSFIDGNRDFSITRLRAPGYTTVDFAADYSVSDKLTVYGRITNLTNVHYQDPTGFLRPSLGAFVGIKAKL
jgi:vitamin B12 transporter